MKLVLDQYAHLDSPIHQWKQTYKLVGLLALIFAFAFIQNLVLLPVIVFIATVVFWLSRLPFDFLLSRLRYPGWFILSMVILLPFLAGNEILWQWGWLSIKQEGLKTSILVFSRFVCILTVSLVLFGTATFLSSIQAMRSLGLPQVIVDMTLLAYRYLEQLGDMLITMQRAVRLRGFQNKKLSFRTLKILAQLTGSLLIRSYNQSQRVYHAMILRGYGYNTWQKYPKQIKYKPQDRYSLIATMISLIAASLLILAEIFLSYNYSKMK